MELLPGVVADAGSVFEAVALLVLLVSVLVEVDVED